MVLDITAEHEDHAVRYRYPGQKGFTASQFFLGIRWFRKLTNFDMLADTIRFSAPLELMDRGCAGIELMDGKGWPGSP
jgi:hypothetical protein